MLVDVREVLVSVRNLQKSKLQIISFRTHHLRSILDINLLRKYHFNFITLTNRHLVRFNHDFHFFWAHLMTQQTAKRFKCVPVLRGGLDQYKPRKRVLGLLESWRNR